MEQELLRSIIQWGPGMVLAGLVLLGLFRLSKCVGMKIVVSFEKQAEALTRQAESMSSLTRTIQDYICRDNNEHREIIILLKVIREKLDRDEEKNGD